jgi:hypothetical protein
VPVTNGYSDIEYVLTNLSTIPAGKAIKEKCCFIGFLGLIPIF